MGTIEFIDLLKDVYLEQYPGTEIELCDVLKNNNVRELKCSFKESEYIAPMFNVDYLIQMYTDGKTMSDIVNTIHSYQNFREGLVTDALCDVTKIATCLINKQKNMERLQDIPYYDVEDLALIFKIIVAHDSNGLQTITVTNKLLEFMKLDKKELLGHAINNQPILTPIIHGSMDDILYKYYGIDFGVTTNKLIVVTFENLIDGASAIVFPNKVIEILKHYNLDKAYCIPSSTNEVLLTPYTGDKSDELSLKSLIKKVNKTCVSKKEFLSDNLYMIDENGVLKMI